MADANSQPECSKPLPSGVARTLIGEISAVAMATYRGWVADRAPRLGASLAFYTLLSLAPMMIVVVAIAGMAFGQAAAQGRLLWEIQGLVGYQGAVAIQAMLKSAHTPATGLLPTVVGLAALFLGATAVVTELRDALNTIWHVQPRETTYWMSVVEVVKSRALAFATVVGVGFLLMVSLLVNAFVSAMGGYFGQLLPHPEWVLHLADSAASFLIISALFALLYKVLPDVCVEWSDVIIGAAATSLLFTLGKFAIGMYLGRAGVASTYGAAGSLVVLLLWVYYSAQIFFFGAEFTCVYTRRYGSMLRRSLELHPATPEQHIVAPRETRDEVHLIVPESFAEMKRRPA